MSSELPIQESNLLQKGLQIPSRRGRVSSGFGLPKILLNAGVTKRHWHIFVRDIRSMASLDLEQYATVALTRCAIGAIGGLFLNVLILPAAGVVGHKMGKDFEMQNMAKAYAFGSTRRCTDRWNRDYFEVLGLHAQIEIPGPTSTSDVDMDITSSKAYKYQHKYGRQKVLPEGTRELTNAKEARYRAKELADHAKAARKVRIVILPVHLIPPKLRARQPDSLQDQAAIQGPAHLIASQDPQNETIDGQVGDLPGMTPHVANLLTANTLTCRQSVMMARSTRLNDHEHISIAHGRKEGYPVQL